MDDDTHEAMLRTEFGGMCEALADLADVTGTDRYAALARRFLDRSLLGPLRELPRRPRRDARQHPDRQGRRVPAARRGRGDPGLRDAARFFWQTVTRHRTFSFGGNSVREHLHPRDDFGSALECPEGPETCNTYNMLKLSRALFRDDPDAEVLDYFERATLNHILSSQHPRRRTGLLHADAAGPLPGRCRRPRTACGAASAPGIESQAKYGELIYADEKDVLFVNLFIASRLGLPEQNLVWSRPGPRPTTTRSHSWCTRPPPPPRRSTCVSPAGTKEHHGSASTARRPRTGRSRSPRAPEQADSP